MKNLLRIKTNHRYEVSKVIYIILLSISIIVDATLAISLYDFLLDHVGVGITRLGILLVALGLGAFLYYLYMAQIEWLTKK